jgi:hypothetical protein
MAADSLPVWSLCGQWRWRKDCVDCLRPRGTRSVAVDEGCVCSGELSSWIMRQTKKPCARFCVCTHCVGGGASSANGGPATWFTAVLLHVRRRCLLAVVDITRSEESRESVEISWRVIRSDLQAYMAGNAQLMLVAGSSAQQSRHVPAGC